MALSNRERVGKALDSLCQGLYVYVQGEMGSTYPIRKDVAALLTVVRNEWNKVFKEKLKQTDLTLVHELIEVRNLWAHQETFSTDETYRAIGSVILLLKSISATEEAEAVEKQRQEVFRLLSQEQARHEVRPIPVSLAEEARIKQRLDELLKRIPFQNAYLLNQALTHTSYKYENPNTGDDNEQLEFIGDALLTFLSGDFLYKRNPDLREGKMTVLRSNLVHKDQLARFAAELELGTWMRLGKGEDTEGVKNPHCLVMYLKRLSVLITWILGLRQCVI